MVGEDVLAGIGHAVTAKAGRLTGRGYPPRFIRAAERQRSPGAGPHIMGWNRARFAEAGLGKPPALALIAWVRAEHAVGGEGGRPSSRTEPPSKVG